MKNNYSKSLRIDQWWEPKAGNILTIIFLALIIFELPFQKSIIYLLPSLITIVGIGGFGHLVNDLFDLKTDRKANKKNSLENKTNFNRLLLVLGTLTLAIAPWFVLPFDKNSIYLLITEFALLILYAAPPFRIKTKGFLAILFDGLYAYAIPSILAFYTFYLLSGKDFNLNIFILIFIWQLFIGIHNILIHHLEDFKNDQISNTKTFAINIGKENTRKLILIVVFPLHILSFLLLSGYVSIFHWNLYFVIPLLYLTINLFLVFRKKSFTNFLKSNNSIDLQLLNIHYHQFLLYWHILILILIDVKFVIFLFIIFIIFKNSFFKWIYLFCFKYLKKNLSYLVNYSIYYFRRFVLFQNPEKARKVYYKEYAAAQLEFNKQNTSTNIAIVNQNLNKYTETFVANRLSSLPYYVHTIYGKGIPYKSNKTFNLVSKNQSLLKFLDWKTYFFNFETNYSKKKAFTNYLINNNITIVLAEFGTTAAEIYDLCRLVNIPLIVTFHGYDIHHAEILKTNKAKYIEMFDYSSKILCVSKEIKAKLKSLGASEEKLKYLPATFFPKDFEYLDHSKNENIFLAIGRFAETKSPHLTILAFKEVLKDIPDAKLIMIGKDGGGELFEACHILVKALKIENQVIFKGILTPKEVKQEMDKAKVFVQHSVTTPINGDKEGTPVSVMEAMANGLAIVATKHAGIQEMIENNVSGILVEEYDYIQMSKEMIEVCENETLNKKLGENAAKSIRSNSLITENIEILTNIIEKNRLK